MLYMQRIKKMYSDVRQMRSDINEFKEYDIKFEKSRKNLVQKYNEYRLTKIIERNSDPDDLEIVLKLFAQNFFTNLRNFLDCYERIFKILNREISYEKKVEFEAFKILHKSFENINKEGAIDFIHHKDMFKKEAMRLSKALNKNISENKEWIAKIKSGKAKFNFLDLFKSKITLTHEIELELRRFNEFFSNETVDRNDHSFFATHINFMRHFSKPLHELTTVHEDLLEISEMLHSEFMSEYKHIQPVYSILKEHGYANVKNLTQRVQDDKRAISRMISKDLKGEEKIIRLEREDEAVIDKAIESLIQIPVSISQKRAQFKY